jgi:hypothetical protein
VNLDAGQHHRAFGGAQFLQRFLHGFVQCPGVARRVTRLWCGQGIGRAVDAIARQFQVHGCAVLTRRLQAAVDVAACGERIVQHRGRARDALKYLALKTERPEAMVQHGIAALFLDARCAADHHHRRGLGVCPGDCIHHIERADPVGYRQRAQSPTTRIAIGGECSGVFAGGPDMADRTVLKLAVETEHIVAGYPEDVIDTPLLQTLQQILGNRNFAHADASLARCL